MKSSTYVALLHYPVYNKAGKVVATSITTFDIHDIARSCKTYGVKRFFVVNPYRSQRAFAKDVLSYWLKGYGATYNENRSFALSIVSVTDTLDAVKRNVANSSGRNPRIVVTSAKSYIRSIKFNDLRRIIRCSSLPFLFLFGTGWGLESHIKRSADYVLEPIVGAGKFNHLSVRSAAAIILDKLLS